MQNLCDQLAVPAKIINEQSRSTFMCKVLMVLFIGPLAYVSVTFYISEDIRFSLLL